MFKISDYEEDVLGYMGAFIGDNIGPAVENGILFYDEYVKLVKNQAKDIPGTEYAIEFNQGSKVDIVRKKEAHVSSGSRLKTVTKPGSGFLKEQVVVTSYMPPTKPDLEVATITVEEAYEGSEATISAWVKNMGKYTSESFTVAV